MSDFMEIGDGLVPIEDGKFLHVPTGNTVDDMGRIWSKDGELIYDPDVDFLS